MEIRIGCTGWSYQGWNGVFYPKKLPPYSHLKYYSSLFDITEINSTYYNIPKSITAKKWHYDTPQNFLFTAKFPKIITHDSRLKNVKDHVLQFLSSIKPLEKKIFGLVIQLPPSLSFDESKPRIIELFEYLPKNYRYSIEGRHESWFTDEAYSFLSENNHCLVWNEIEGVQNPAIITSDYIYLRLIGDRSIPESQFGKVIKNKNDTIEKWIKLILKVQDEVGLALIMANNHFEGFAPATANTLRKKLGMNEVLWEEKKQKSLTEF